MNEPHAQTSRSIEEALMQELRFGGLDQENLKEMVGIVAGIQKRGLKGLKAFPKGIPRPDSLSVAGVVDAGEVHRFLGEILAQTPRFSRVELFPYGIPFPELFRINIDIGAGSISGTPLPA
jgi:hypothetical protein